MDHASLLEVVEERNRDAYGFTLRASANGLLHRVLPVRDPRQHRFWSIVVFRCSPGGIPDIAEQPWVGPGGFLREELKAVMAEIRADPSAWFAQPAFGDLLDWMLAPDSAPVPAAGARTGLRAPLAMPGIDQP